MYTQPLVAFSISSWC